MRIMHISTRLILGGSQENTVLSCEGQSSPPYSHDVSLVFGPIYGPEGSLLGRARDFRSKEGSAPGGGDGERRIQCIETPNLIRELNPLRDLKCYRELRALIRSWKPEVVHTHSSKAGILGRAAAWKEHVPCIIHTIHGLAFHPYETRWRNAIYIANERWAAKRCHRILCVAQAMRDQSLAARVGRAEQYDIVYSGMEIDRYLTPDWKREDVRRELGYSDNDFVLGTVARLAELKGHDDLLDALGPLMRERPELKLLWIGDGWWRDRLLARVRDLTLSDRVMTTGLVPSEQIPKYLTAMDALAHASYREGLPRTVPQALLCARPVIAYDVDGTREVCIEGVTGKLITPGDRTMLREAVHWMMDHPTERAAMAHRGRELCRTRFDHRVMIAELQKIYEQVLYKSAGHARHAK